MDRPSPQRHRGTEKNGSHKEQEERTPNDARISRCLPTVLLSLHRPSLCVCVSVVTSMLFSTEIGFLHSLVSADFLRRPAGDHLAVDQHRDAVGEIEYHAHV